MSILMCILLSVVLLGLCSVWIGVKSIWTVERRVNDIRDYNSAIKRDVSKIKAINDYLLRELNCTAQWDFSTDRYIISSVCCECLRNHNYPGPSCAGCSVNSRVRLGLTEKEIKLFMMKLDEIYRHVK